MPNSTTETTTQWPPRIIVSAPQGRSGKTTISIGLCAALKRRGLQVQPFKKGPDYIDPSWLTMAAGRRCRNLDAILMPEEILQDAFQQACIGADVAVIEGAMGLYDGLDSDGLGSTAQLASILDCPVILVINTTRMTNSVAAMVKGYQCFNPNIHIAGIILNNVAGSRHEAKLVTAVEQHCGIPVVGIMPKDKKLNISERHLGLVPYHENEQVSTINYICHSLEKKIELDRILDIARSAVVKHSSRSTTAESKRPRVRLGVILDRIFTFYYPENLEALTNAGAELVYIDSTRTERLPDIDGLYIGGGFPELFLKDLEANRGLRMDISQEIEAGLPVYAECAGLMYLCQKIRWHGENYEMVGAIPAEVELSQRPRGHGYVLAEVCEDNPWLPKGLKFWGHEFHYSTLLQIKNGRFAYRIQRGQGIDGLGDGIIYKNVLASYTHLHALGVPMWADAFVSLALHQRKHGRSPALTHS